MLFPNRNEYSKYFYQNHRGEYAEWDKAWKQKHIDRVRQSAIESYRRNAKLRRDTQHAKWLEENWCKAIAVMFAWRLYLSLKPKKFEKAYRAARNGFTRITVGAKRVRLWWYVRKGLCSRCGTEGANYNSPGQFPILPWLGLEEICFTCWRSVIKDRFARSRRREEICRME
jgi:hypothetical protein